MSVISAMAAAASATPPSEGKRAKPRKPVITLSRDYGAGGEAIATRLGERLGVPVYDEQLLEEVARRLQDDPAMVRMLDESMGRTRDMWLYRLLSGKDLGHDAYREALVRVVMSLGRLGGVIVGRGAHLILAEGCALRVRIAGSPEVCARRMAEQGHGTYQAELDKANEANHRRGKFVWDMFHSRLADASQFDVTVNTDRMSDYEDVVEMLVGMASAIHAGRVLKL
jgi:hypothetical protein